MFTSSQSFDNLSRFLFDASQSSLSIRRALSKSESAIETPTTTSDERHSSLCSSISRSFSRSPPRHERIESWQNANETPIWQKMEKTKRKRMLRFTINKTTAEETEERKRNHMTIPARWKNQKLKEASLNRCLNNRKITENEEQQQRRTISENGKTKGGRIVLVFRKYKIGDPESTV